MTQFYDSLASHYHLIFQDWDASIARQAGVTAKLLPSPATAGRVLDCACGIGTQTLGLAALGYQMEGSDLSVNEIERARREAADRKLDIPFRVDDMRMLAHAPPGSYGAIINMDNAVAHLDSDSDIAACLTTMRDRLAPGGTLLVSLRDYAPLMRSRPTSLPPTVYDDGKSRRIVSQVWNWIDERRYETHLSVTTETGGNSATQTFIGRLRAVTTDEIITHAHAVGFRAVRVLSTAETGYYQPIALAIAPSG